MMKPPDYSIRLVSSSKSSLKRQIKEALLIEPESPDIQLINGKSECGQNRVPRVRTTLPEHMRHPKHEEKNLFNKRPNDDQNAMMISLLLALPSMILRIFMANISRDREPSLL